MQTLKEKPVAPKAAVATQVNSGSVAVINSALLRQDSKHAIKLSSEDVTTPRLKALMATSPEINDLPDAKAGMIFNTVTKKLYDGNAGIIVVPCAWVKQYVEWNDIGTGSGGPVRIYDANSDILSQTVRDEFNKDRTKSGTYIETNYNYFVLVLNNDLEYIDKGIVSMKSTQLKKAKKWNAMMGSVFVKDEQGSFQPPIYTIMYKLKTVKEQNKRGTWIGWDVNFAFEDSDSIKTQQKSTVTDMNIYQQARLFAESIAKGETKIKPEDREEVEKTTAAF